MRIVMFYQSLVSDWNHGNAHFLRGVATDLIHRGHSVRIFEPKNSWCRENLVADHGEGPIQDFQNAYPVLKPEYFDGSDVNSESYLDEILDDADLVIVHEWNTPELVKKVGEHRARSRDYQLFFHDTHHRMVTQPEEMNRYDLKNYDGVLAFGKVIAELYLARGLTERVWVWHEAADARLFRPIPTTDKQGDLVWIGNWGDEERSAELDEYLFQPAAELGLKTEVHGVRYPERALETLRASRIQYRSWLPNFRVPEVFSRFRVTIHVPRRPYARALPGIPTIRVFEALACGISLISAPWEDAEGLFSPGRDFLVARNGKEMKRFMREVLDDPALGLELARSGRSTVLQRHTCAHRVNELLDIYAQRVNEYEKTA